MLILKPWLLNNIQHVSFMANLMSIRLLLANNLLFTIIYSCTCNRVATQQHLWCEDGKLETFTFGSVHKMDKVFICIFEHHLRWLLCPLWWYTWWYVYFNQIKWVKSLYSFALEYIINVLPRISASKVIYSSLKLL